MSPKSVILKTTAVNNKQIEPINIESNENKITNTSQLAKMLKNMNLKQKVMKKVESNPTSTNNRNNS